MNRLIILYRALFCCWALSLKLPRRALQLRLELPESPQSLAPCASFGERASKVYLLNASLGTRRKTRSGGSCNSASAHTSGAWQSLAKLLLQRSEVLPCGHPGELYSLLVVAHSTLTDGSGLLQKVCSCFVHPCEFLYLLGNRVVFLLECISSLSILYPACKEFRKSRQPGEAKVRTAGLEYPLPALIAEGPQHGVRPGCF